MIFPDHAPQYGAIDTYRIAADWLDGHGTVYDWGSGKSFARPFFEKSLYVGLDGTFKGPDNVELATVKIDCASILMRHVLENNPERWKEILLNAIASFHQRMALVTFTEFADRTHVYKTEAYASGDLAYLQFRKADLTELMGDFLVGERSVPTTHPEHVFFLEK